MTENAELRRMALTVLTHHAGPDAGAEALASAAQLTYDNLARATAQLIGQAGVDALTGRALHLVQRDYPWLVHRRGREQEQGAFAQIILCLKRQDPAVASEAAGAMFATLTGLLITFIGESLTSQLLRKAWPDAFSAGSAEETKHEQEG